MPEQREPIVKTFAHHTPSPETLLSIREIRAGFSTLHERIMLHCPPTRERSVAITNLETACMWAIKAIVCNDPTAVVEDK